MRFAAFSICVWLGMWSASAATVAVTKSPAALRNGPHNEPIVDVRVNGLGPFPFILDTGSTHSSIGDRLSRSLKAPLVAKATVTSSFGEHVEPIVRLDALEVGGATTADILATEVSEDALNDGNKTEARGILGQDVLGSRVYALNFAERRVEWDIDPRASGRASTVVLRDVRGRFLAELPQNQDQDPLWLVPDTGAELLVLYQRPQLKLPAMTRAPDFVRLRTLSDRQTVESVRVSELWVGRANLKDVPAVLVKRTDADPSFGDGLLPVTMFARVTFDGPGRRLLIER